MLSARVALGGDVPPSDLFATAGDASELYRRASRSFSSTRRGHRLDTVDIEPDEFCADPVGVLSVESSYFDDCTRFPEGSAMVDSALVMRDVLASWRSRRPPVLGDAR
jgi:hypothetical protein